MAKLILRRLLRLLTRELPRLLLGVPGRDDAVCDLHETLDLLHAVVDETLPQGAEPQGQGDAERDQEQRNEQHQSMRDAHSLDDHHPSQCGRAPEKLDEPLPALYLKVVCRGR